jgi:uncharacterized membrane protein YgcG
MIVCNQCGNPLEAEERWCSECGAQAAADKSLGPETVNSNLRSPPPATLPAPAKKAAATSRSSIPMYIIIALLALIAGGGVVALFRPSHVETESNASGTPQASSTSTTLKEGLLPKPSTYVNDYAEVIDTTTKQRLETTLADFDHRQGFQFAVVTIDTTNGQDIFDFSLAVARSWAVGSKDAQKPSLLLLVAIKDRKYFTQVSKHLQGTLPDVLVGQIQRDHLVPAFRAGQYGKGLEETIGLYISAVAPKPGENSVERTTDASTNNPSSPQSAPVSQPSSGTWFVVLGSFPKNDREKANQRLQSVQASGYSASIIDTDNYPGLSGGLWAVVMGPYSKASAKSVADQIRVVRPDAYIKSGW